MLHIRQGSGRVPLMWSGRLTLAVIAIAGLLAPMTAEAAPACSSVNPYSAPAPCPMAQPGIYVKRADVDYPSDCTLGFLFRGSDGATYALVDGGCIDKQAAAFVNVGDTPDVTMRWAKGKGPIFVDRAGKLLGRAVLRQIRDERTDAAWIRLDRGVRFDPSVVEFGPPGPIDTAIDGSLAEFGIYGQGGGVSGNEASHPSRTGAIPRGRNATDVVWIASQNDNEDSGAPVLLLLGDGRPQALGISSGASGAVRVGNDLGLPVYGDAEPTEVGTPVYRLEPLRLRAEKELKLRLALLSEGQGVAR